MRYKLKLINGKSKFIIISMFFMFLVFSVSTFVLTYGEGTTGTTLNEVENLSGIYDNVVIVDDEVSDYNYYMGLNYTDSFDGVIPDGTNQNLYSSDNLVKVIVNYYGASIIDDEMVGYVSLDEKQDTFTYYKYYPVSDGYINIELIDNPFTDRPDDMGFNGWVTDYSGVTLSYDDNYYTRYARVPVTSTDGILNPIEIDFYANWYSANVGYITSTNNSWSNVFSNFKAKGFQQIGGTVYIYEDVTGYYIYGGNIGFRESYPDDAVNNQGRSVAGNRCNTYGGCTYYLQVTSNNYDPSQTYYELTGNGNNRRMTVHEVEITGSEEIPVLEEGTLIAGLYNKVTVSRNASVSGYYDENGLFQESGVCSVNGGCTYYELIQYYDNQGSVNVADGESAYYLFVTRDINIAVMMANTSSTWTQSYPFTLTSIYNGVDYTDSVTWNVSNLAVNCYSDTRIENIKINSNQGNSTNSPTGSSGQSRYFYGNYHNVKIGRGIIQNNTYKTFNGVFGGNNVSTAFGSRTDVTKYKLEVESGFYNTITLTNGAGYTNNNKYIEGLAWYGNDYDRVDTNDDNLDVYYVAAGSWGNGVYYSSSDAGITFDTVVKSGRYGSQKGDDHTVGIYIGGRSYGTHNTSRRVKIEGGWTYNLIGGPMTGSTRSNINDTYVFMTGGSVDMIIGGAGTSATYGNRIISLTGGVVNYSVFGGSNGYDGEDGDGTINGSSFVYVGGNAIVGNSDYVNNGTTLWGAEAGSVFGIGNGKDGTASIGSNDNSNIIIDGDCSILNNVYGGGNYGATGISSTSNTNTTSINIVGGEVFGSVYGGGNNNGAGSSSKKSTVNITMNGGIVDGSIYGGSRYSGVVYGDVNLNINKGIVRTSVYGGGEGGYTNNNDTGTFITGAVLLNVGLLDDDNNNLKILGSVYGGSAFGTVNGDTPNTALSNYNTSVVVNAGTILNVFGGGEGNDTFTPYVKGNVSVDINGGAITNVFGGNDLKGTPNGSIVVNINDGVVTNAYAGGNKTEVVSPSINFYGGVITNGFGGGNQAKVDNSNVLLDGSVVTNLFGGSNASGDVSISNVVCDSGTATNVFGGNNIGGTTNVTNVTINGGDIDSVYGGGEKTNVTESTNVNLNARVNNLFGGSDSEGEVLVSYINVNDGIATNIYGGNNLGGTTITSNIMITGGIIDSVYGGGLQASTDASNINVNYGKINNLYGGGSNAGVNDTHVNLGRGYVTNTFGGSNTSGDVGTSNIKNIDSNLTTSNLVVDSSFSLSNINNSGATGIASSETINVSIKNNTGVDIVNWDLFLYTSDSILDSNWSDAFVSGVNGSFYVNEIDQYYGTNPISNGGTYSFNFNIHSYVSYDEFKILDYVIVGYDANGNQYKNISFDNLFLSNVYGGNNFGGITDFSNIDLTYGVVDYLYGGGNEAVTNTPDVYIDGIVVNEVVYGGGNQAEITNDTVVVITNDANILGSVYGGGNAGIVNGNTVVDIDNSSVYNVYGGGNQANVLGNTDVKLDTVLVLNNVYGGGNQAAIIKNTNVSIDSCDITGNIFGGGNNGVVYKNASTIITSSLIGESVYAGGNGTTAYVLGNNLINVSGNSSIDKHVFGGGNAALTGCGEDILDSDGSVVIACSSPDSSYSEVNIAGATVLGNVYGGANTSVVYGETFVNIGIDTIDSSYGLDSGNIYIAGNVFGGGEANASGSEDYDFSFISVTKGINININANGHNVYNIDGSIFGSGNASSSGGYSYIDINNYGTSTLYKSNISIQRADIVTLNNSAIELDGAGDRTNKYKDELFSISRVKKLKLKNGSILYLNKRANLLENFYSLVDVDGKEVAATVDIDKDNSSVSRSGDNRIYLLEGVNLDISDDESLATYGEVVGMSFFGMFTKDRNGVIETALYSSSYDYGDLASGSDLYYFTKGSYIRGEHKDNHDYYKDGFYTNYVNEEGTGIVVDYIDPTPDDAIYYRWSIGEESKEIRIETLTASKYSILGTYELQLDQWYSPNTEIQILGVNYDDLDSDIDLVASDDIPRHAASVDEANTIFGLGIQTGTNGWITKGETEFLTVGSKDIVGTTIYKTENSTTIPNLMFYFYHSKNLTENKDLGTVSVSLMIVTPIDDLNDKVERVNLVIPLATKLYDGDNYEASITPGPKYEMFANSNVNITSKSSFSAYYSLYIPKDTTPYKSSSYRTLISSYAFPVNTKITMIDLASSDKPEYYYYVVDDDNYSNSLLELNNEGEVSYKLSDFIKMGSSSLNNTYDDSVANSKYYDDTLDKAEEEFIFIVDFCDSNINSDVFKASLLFEVRDNNDNPYIPVLDIAQPKMVYNLYYDKDAVIDATASLSKNSIYLGKSVDLNVVTDFRQQVVDDINIIDTNFYEQKLGIKLTILDSSSNVVNGASLLGVNFVYDGVTYYPRVDGTTRFNLAESVANVSSKITINTENSNLATDTYTLLIEAFGSSDGIYYGVSPSSQLELNLDIVNAIYGLSVEMSDNDVLIDRETGLSSDNDNNLEFLINYSSGLSNANLRLALYRRTYDDIYNYDYEKIDVTRLIASNLSGTQNKFEYMLTDRPSSVNRTILEVGNNLMTGTYKLEFMLYDGDTFIGSDYKYVIVQ